MRETAELSWWRRAAMSDRGVYRTIVADPPWEYEDGTGASYSARGRRDCDLPYPTMTVDEIAALADDVRALADKRSTLFFWTTNRYLADAFHIVAAWGYPHIATLVWCKQRGLGSGGVFYSNVEFVLYCRRPQVAAPARIHSRWFDWPRGAHSAKPEALLDLVEQVSPGPYLEMFARRNRLGWDTWGNEALEHVEIEGAA
jgi:N6-adenosine-specific RNA methylase IME4